MQDNLFNVFKSLRDPAFLMRGGQIVDANGAAAALGLLAGNEVPDGLPEPANETVFGALTVGGTAYSAAVTRIDECAVCVLTPPGITDGSESAKIAGAIAYAMREPLSILSIAAQTLLPFVSEMDDKAVDSGAMLNRSIYMLRRLCDNLNVFIQGGEVREEAKSWFDLTELCAEVVQTAADITGREIKFVCGLNELRFRGEQQPLQKIMYALIGNALRYAGSGATIRVSLAVSGKYASIMVADNGYGIDPAKLGDIQARYRAERMLTDFGGAGFGLSLVYAVAERHNGRVQIVSKPGEGTTVNVRLALSDEPESLSFRQTQRDFTGMKADVRIELADVLSNERYRQRYLD